MIALFVVLDNNRDIEPVQNIQIHIGQLGNNRIGSPFLGPTYHSFITMQFTIIERHPVKGPGTRLTGIPDHTFQQATSVAAGEIRQQQNLNHETYP